MTDPDPVAHRLAAVAEVFDDSPEPVVVLDRLGRLRYVNPPCVSLFGVGEASMLGRPLTDFAEPSKAGAAPDAKFHSQLHSRPGESARARSGCVLRGHLSLQVDGGEARWVAWSASPLRRPEGEGIGAVLFLRDETERHRDALQWKHRRDELEQTLRAVVHDLRSPLVSVLGFSRLLRDDFGRLLGERGTHFLDRIAEAGRTMEALLQDLLDFARIGHPAEAIERVDPLAVLSQLRGEMKPRLDAQRVSLRLPDEAPMLSCNRTRLYQVFSNLIGNALDHMGPCAEPRIEVSVAEEGSWHHLVVADNGRGVPASEHERIFEMFHTAPREGGRRGTGIGLAIVKKVAEIYGGRAYVESEPGAGARFHVLLPRR